MVGGAGRDRVRLAAALLDRRERVLPAPPDPDVEAGRVEPHVRAHDPREEDVADLVVDGVRPVDPVLLHEHAAEAEPCRDGRDLPRVVRLHAADRDERVAALRERVRGEVLELAHLVAAVREARVAVLALRPDVDRAAEVLAQPLEPVDGRRPEEERDAIEALDAHCAILRGAASASRTAGATSRPSSSIERRTPLVRHPADRELHEEAVVPEDLVLEEDLLDDLLGRPDEVRAAERRRRVVVGA